MALFGSLMFVTFIMAVCGQKSLNVYDANVNPGLKVRLSQSGLEYAASVGVDIVSSKVMTANIPDQHGELSPDVTYDITDMTVTQFDPPSSAVTVSEGLGIIWSLSNMNIAIEGNWGYKLLFIKDHGTFVATASGDSITASATIGTTPDGHPTISSTGCSCNIDHLKITVHGGASWLYNLFMKYIEKPVKSDLQYQICKAVVEAINNNAAQALATLQIQVLIDNYWLLNYGFVAPPSFVANYVETFHKAEFFQKDDITEAPFQPATLPSPPSTDHMLTFWASDYILNTFGYALQKHNILRHTITRSDLPADQRVRLNTTCDPADACIGILIPEIGMAYPNATVEVEVMSTVAPYAVISETNVTGMFAGLAILRARLGNGSLANLFGLNITDASFSVTPRLNGTTLQATVDSIGEKLSAFGSSIGPINVASIQMLFDIAKTTQIIPKLNAVGARGFPLPSIDHIQFVNSALQMMSDCLCVKTDVRYYQPPDAHVV